MTIMEKTHILIWHRFVTGVFLGIHCSWLDWWGRMVHAERGHESAGLPNMATQAWAMPPA